MAREMKNSGVKWIGEIPNNWNVKKVKYNFGVIGGCGFNEKYQGESQGDYPFCKASDINGLQKHVSGAANYVSKQTAIAERYNIIPVGSIIFAKIGEALKKNHRKINTVECIVDNNCQAIYQIANNDINYMYYLWKQIDMTWFDNAGTIPCVNNQRLKSFPIPIPPLSDQKAIADFLDKKCAEIDGLLADLEAEVKTLAEYKKSIIAETVTRGLNPNAPMKQSGIPWAETIPAHWDIQKGKYTFRLLQRPVKEDDGVITCFRDGEVTLRSNRREDGFTMSAKEYGYQGIEPGDLVVHGMDGFAGSIGISDSRGKGTPVLNVLDSKYNKRYLMYYLRNMAYGDVFLALSTGIRVRSCDLGWKKLGEIRIVLPPIEEQEKIADYIDHKLDEIQNAIVNKTQQIETLKAYKSSLIYEYVTGKKQVI